MGFIVKCDVCGIEKVSFPDGRRMPDCWHEAVVDGLATELDVEVICLSCIYGLRRAIRLWDTVEPLIDKIAKDAERICGGS